MSSHSHNADLIAQLRGGAICIYIAAPENVAEPIAKLMRQAADALEQQDGPSDRDAVLEEAAKEVGDYVGDKSPESWVVLDTLEKAVRRIRALKNAAPQVPQKGSTPADNTPAGAAPSEAGEER